MQKLFNVSKEVARFLFILIIKLLEKSKQDPIALETNKKRNSGNLIRLLRSIYNGISSIIAINSQKLKENKVASKEIKPKKKRKTWARVKQDFKEWYATLIEEFEEKQKAKQPEDIEEQPEEVEEKPIEIVEKPEDIEEK